jgi:hypothetical protein
VDFPLTKSELCMVIRAVLEHKESLPEPAGKREQWERDKLDSAVTKLEQCYHTMKD